MAERGLLAFFRPVYGILHTQCDAVKFGRELGQSLTRRVVTHPFGHQLACFFRAFMPVIWVLDKILATDLLGVGYGPTVGFGRFALAAASDAAERRAHHCLR